ncbi:MAG: hypothetical protein IT371_02820 [Deltaproteobacteria bacterium]|nr:hypothetical protein [Deltaproteobacteria bacterium]
MTVDTRAAYYQRVRAVVGDSLADGHAAIWDLGFGYLAAEALARTGLRRQTWFDGGAATGAFCRSLGWRSAGQPRGPALSEHCQRHNRFEQNWSLTCRPRELDELRRVLSADPPHVLLARGDEHAPALARLALDHGVPLVLAFVPRTGPAHALHVVWLPGSRVDPEALLSFCGELSALPQLDLDRLEHHLEGLEARSVGLSLARWILARDRPPRPDLEEPLVHAGAAVLLRGGPDWPWAVGFARPSGELLERLGRAASPRYLPPAAFRGKERVLVLGLGTASLLCAELGPWAKQLLAVDCKPVSPYNPVRQIYGTDCIGQNKGEALLGILADRWDPTGAWETRRDGDLLLRVGAQHTLATAELELTAENEDARRRFAALLDAFQPSLAVVAMGRSRDDNFVAAAELRRRGIRHVTPTAFPGVSHFKHILTDGSLGPCYDCLQGHLAIDGGAAPTLQAEERDLFYGGTQPATLAETLPSAHSLLRVVTDLALPAAARPPYLLRELAHERNCWVGANRVERRPEGWLYGVARPFNLVTYGVEDLVGSRAEERCPCGRVNPVRRV